MVAKTKTEKLVDAQELLTEVGKKVLDVQAPASFDLESVEMSGQLVLLRGYVNVFGKVREVTRVYKRVR